MAIDSKLLIIIHKPFVLVNYFLYLCNKHYFFGINLMMKKNISIEVNSPKFGIHKSSKKGSSRVKVYEDHDNYIGSSGSYQP